MVVKVFVDGDWALADLHDLKLFGTIPECSPEEWREVFGKYEPDRTEEGWDKA